MDSSSSLGESCDLFPPPISSTTPDHDATPVPALIACFTPDPGPDPEPDPIPAPGLSEMEESSIPPVAGRCSLYRSLLSWERAWGLYPGPGVGPGRDASMLSIYWESSAGGCTVMQSVRDGISLTWK